MERELVVADRTFVGRPSYAGIAIHHRGGYSARF
jgi:hypothetical protein